MKVCIINLNVYCLFNPQSSAPMGGAELDMYTVAIALKKYFHVSIITGDWKQKDIEEKDDIIIYKSFSFEKNLLNYVKAPFVFWNTLCRANADVYVSSGAGPEVGVIALFCKLKKKKFIYRTASSMDCDGSYVKIHSFLGKIYEYGLNQSSKIITSVKQHSEILLVRYPELSRRINHINLGILSHGDELEKEYILWVGRCDSLKNPEIFLDVARSLPQFLFFMICPKQSSNPEYFEEIKKMAQSLTNITFIDFVPFRDIQPYFDRAKIFVNTSDFEGFTYTLIQSGLARTPVVYLNVNPDEVITKYNIGYVADGDKKKMISQIVLLLNDKKDWKEKSINALQYVTENHDINIIGGQWRDLIYRLLKK